MKQGISGQNILLHGTSIPCNLHTRILCPILPYPDMVMNLYSMISLSCKSYIVAIFIMPCACMTSVNIDVFVYVLTVC